MAGKQYCKSILWFCFFSRSTRISGAGFVSGTFMSLYGKVGTVVACTGFAASLHLRKPISTNFFQSTSLTRHFQAIHASGPSLLNAVLSGAGVYFGRQSMTAQKAEAQLTIAKRSELRPAAYGPLSPLHLHCQYSRISSASRGAETEADPRSCAAPNLRSLPRAGIRL
jgi:hypothetical protein